MIDEGTIEEHGMAQVIDEGSIEKHGTAEIKVEGSIEEIVLVKSPDFYSEG